MKNGIKYQNMLNSIRGQKISKNKTPQFTDVEIAAWNSAVEVCYQIYKLRMKPTHDAPAGGLSKHAVIKSVCAKCKAENTALVDGLCYGCKCLET